MSDGTFWGLDLLRPVYGVVCFRCQWEHGSSIATVQFFKLATSGELVEITTCDCFLPSSGCSRASDDEAYCFDQDAHRWKSSRRNSIITNVAKWCG